MTLVSMLKLCMAIFMVLGAASHAAEAVIICSGIQENLTPCIPHLTSSSLTQGTPPANCCIGVKSVKALAETTGEHRAVCQCMKLIATRISRLNYDHAAKLSTLCGVSMSYNLSPNTDCSKI